MRDAVLSVSQIDRYSPGFPHSTATNAFYSKVSCEL
jgi:hypothetical protein